MTVGFTQQSRLFEAFMARDDLFDRLLAHDGGFAKFHRVLTDEAIARRLTIADAAAVLGIAADDLVALAEGRDPESLRIVPAPADREEVLAPGTPAVVVDTRPVFEEGREPLAALLDAAEALAPNESLEVLAPFHPVPLRRLLALRSLASCARQTNDAWKVTFARLAEA